MTSNITGDIIETDYSLEQEMVIFDSLPNFIRVAMNESHHSYAPSQVMKMIHKGRSTLQILKSIKKSDRRNDKVEQDECT